MKIKNEVNESKNTLPIVVFRNNSGSVYLWTNLSLNVLLAIGHFIKSVSLEGAFSVSLWHAFVPWTEDRAENTSALGNISVS